MAGLIALVQTDIKRVIAYSTMSQIGYMFLAVGLGANANGMFHLMTHAFFKALLFLAAGIVIHALAGEQDIRKMGGLRRLMPFTWICFWIGGLALVGIASLRRLLLEGLDPRGRPRRRLVRLRALVVGLVGAFLTGLYTFRMIFLVFGGEPSAFVREHFHPHGGKEGPPTDDRARSRARGALTRRRLLQFAPVWHPLTRLARRPSPSDRRGDEPPEAIASIVAVALGLAGIGVAWAIYVAEKRARAALPVRAARPREPLLLRRALRRRLLPADRLDREAFLRAGSRSRCSPSADLVGHDARGPAV